MSFLRSSVYRAMLIAIIVLPLILIGAPALAADDDRGDDDGDSKPVPPPIPEPPEKPETAEKQEPPATSPEPAAIAEKNEILEPGFMIIQCRFGGGAAAVRGDFAFEDIDPSFDEESNFSSNTSDYFGYAVDLNFFPTKGRGFLINTGISNTFGRFNIRLDHDDSDENFAYRSGLDKANVQYYLWDVHFGLGYRWLKGPVKQHGASLFPYFAFGPAEFAIDGFAADGGVNGMLGISANYYYRMPSKLLFGLQFDVRGYTASFSEVTYGPGYSKNSPKMDFNLASISPMVSLFVGYEVEKKKP